MIHSLKRAILAGGLALATLASGFGILAVATEDAHAIDPPWPDAVYGRPTNFEPGGPNGWYLWKDDDGFQLCSTTPADILHPFIAVLKTDGTFHDLAKVRLEEADDIVVKDGGKTLVVKFHTWSAVDCLEFRTTGDKLNLRLTEFGLLIPTSRIFVGHGAWHPANNPFTINR